MSSRELARWQTTFKRYLLDGADEAQLAQAIADPTGADATTRLDVYRNAYHIRLQTALAHDFPTLLATLGDAAFGRRMAAYLRAHPSTCPSLRQLGQHLPHWFRRNSEQALADLAALEWALLEAFDAPDAPALQAKTLLAIPPAQWRNLHFMLHPSLSLLTIRSNADALWRARRNNQALPPLDATPPSHLAAWRKVQGPALHTLSPEAFLMLHALKHGCAFGEICVQLAEQETGTNAPDTAARLLWESIARGWIKSAYNESPKP